MGINDKPLSNKEVSALDRLTSDRLIVSVGDDDEEGRSVRWSLIVLDRFKKPTDSGYKFSQ